MQREILRIWKGERTTVILVTHDIDEAVYLADRVMVLSPRPGSIRNIVDIGLARPRDRAAADFTQIRQRIYDEFFSREEVLEPPYFI
jgi:sulfonate transport system ATP-binding protein